jgi:hypothetical protein
MTSYGWEGTVPYDYGSPLGEYDVIMYVLMRLLDTGKNPCACVVV